MKLHSLAAVILLATLVLNHVSLLATSMEPLYQWTSTVELQVPGVALTPNGYIGTMSKLIVTVAWPGKGIVYFSADPLTELDTQAAARMAALIASILAGVNYYSYDYFIRLESNTSIVGGPSASGAMAVAILAALRGINVPTNFSMTGMVDPDATLGPVGGIPQKLEAAARAGVKVFVIPIGERYSTDLNTGEKVDIVALGRELGVNVIEASTIADAYEIATGDKLTPKNVTLDISYPPWLVSSLNESINFYKKTARSNMTCAEEALSGLSTSLASSLVDILRDAKHNMDVGTKLEAAGKLYAAASRYFAAAIETTYACNTAKAYSSTNPLQVLTKLSMSYINETTAILQNVENKFNESLRANMTSITDVQLQLYIASMTRLLDANSSLNTASALLGIAEKAASYQALQALSRALQAAIYAYYRALTANHWLTLALQAADDGEPINLDLLYRSVETYTYFAESAVNYLQTLGVNIADTAEQIALAKDVIQRGMERRDPVKVLQALAYTVKGLADVNSQLHAVFNTGIAVLDASKRSLSVLLQRLADLNVTLILPLLYTEYADTLVDVNAKLGLYVQSSSYALLLALVANKQAGTPITALQGGEKCSSETMTVTKTTTIVNTTTTTVEKTITVTSTTTTTETISKTVAGETGSTRSSPTLQLLSYVLVAGIALAVGVASERMRRQP
ncbi:Archaeal serine protease [Pyrodictium delaneyi]|uniref:Archaeal serine protease n=1 Tax=Pyrodictium delaneyi TaxID=1273541 RepID=A0A0N7JCQ8_9CREN|nr:S16 family serine protease [Pyrodictium delaneyi]ALL00073.1 Archaeal serine protease [Pyrodictium delaneyi]